MPKGFPVAQRLKRLPPMWEIGVRSLGQEDPLEKEMATHSSILAWRIPWSEEPGRLQSTGSQRVRHDRATSLSLSWCLNCFTKKVVYTENFFGESRIFGANVISSQLKSQAPSL